MSGPTKEQENTERPTIHSAGCPCVDCEIDRLVYPPGPEGRVFKQPATRALEEAVAEANEYWEGKLQANYADTFFLALLMCIMAPTAEAAEAGIEMAERIAALMPPARVQEIKAEAEKVLLVGDGDAEALAALRLANSLEEKGPNGLPSGGAK